MAVRSMRLKTLVLLGGLSLSLPIGVSAGKRLGDYPLRVEIARSHWRRNPARSCHSAPGLGLSCPYGFLGVGVGSVVDGQVIRGFNFEYDCAIAVRMSLGTSHPAKWKKPQQRLAVIIERISEPGTYDECVLKTTMQPGAGVVGPRRSRGGGAVDDGVRPLEGPSQASERGWIVSVAVTSNPDGSEIEVDGEVMGSTPSSIGLASGEHVVVLRKRGFKAWERKLQLAGGTIRLNADLESDEAK